MREAGGTLTRTGQPAAQVLATVRAVLVELARHELLTRQPNPGSVPARWELGQPASLAGVSAHALDSDTVAGSIVLRALAAVHEQPVPATAAQRRELWALAGVTSDTVSGTVLVWALRPEGAHPWAAMMRARADLGLVTHLTLQELVAVPADLALAAAGAVVHACENPQVLQAAARAGVAQPLVCFSGNSAGAGAGLLERLVATGVTVRYHGDFDWPGVQIAARMIAAGATVWRMTAADYRAAVTSVDADAQLPLDGTGRALWDPELTTAMHEAGWAVHEEVLLPVLLTDLRATEAAPPHSTQPPGW